jgi:radical SAM-linked protein
MNPQRIEIKYKKGEEIKFISHRDLMRAFQRAIRRAELPIDYSQGFNPHMKISWGQALKVGATSENETATLQMAEWLKPDEVKHRLNLTLPPGLAITEANLV